MKRTLKQRTLKEIYDARLSENKSLPKTQQFEHVYKQEITNNNYKYKQTTKKLIKLEIGRCPECDNNTYCTDYHRGERVCPGCGYVFSNTVFEKSRYVPLNKINQTRFSEKDKAYLKNKNFHFVTEAKEWKKRQVQREIDVICSSLQLNKHTKKVFEEIISKTTLKKLHNKAKTTTILVGVARYCIKNMEHQNLVKLRFDRGIFQDNLDRNDYEVIERNIHNIFGDVYDYYGKKKKKKNKRRKRKGKKHY